VVQGICSASPKYNSEPIALLRLWMHENLRVYYDRLINAEDKALFTARLLEVARCFDPVTEARLEDQRLVFADFMQGRDAEPRHYFQVDELNKLVEKMGDFL
jgi:dynein heavy chain, axonemal